MFNVWIVGALLLLLLFVLATFGSGDDHLEDDHGSRRRLPMKLDAQNEVEKEVAGLVEEKKDLRIDDSPRQ